VLPDGQRGVLHDLRVFTKRGPDDAIYDENADIREKVRLLYSFSTAYSLSHMFGYLEQLLGRLQKNFKSNFYVCENFHNAMRFIVHAVFEPEKY
jgi:hypothetical protein